jgi:hypothetical protein
MGASLDASGLRIVGINTYVETRKSSEPRRSSLPAYGPIDALLSYVVFYIFVDRATPTVVEVITTALPNISPSLVQLGLAVALWFILAVTLIDQLRRQLAAFGVGSHDDVSRAERSGVAPTDLQLGGYLVVLLLGSIIATWTFEPAIRAGISFIQIVGTLDTSAFVLVEFGLMIVFFISFAGATRALDRLIIGGSGDC